MSLKKDWIFYFIIFCSVTLFSFVLNLEDIDTKRAPSSAKSTTLKAKHSLSEKMTHKLSSPVEISFQTISEIQGKIVLKANVVSNIDLKDVTPKWIAQDNSIEFVNTKSISTMNLVKNNSYIFETEIIYDPAKLKKGIYFNLSRNTKPYFSVQKSYYIGQQELKNFRLQQLNEQRLEYKKIKKTATK